VAERDDLGITVTLTDSRHGVSKLRWTTRPEDEHLRPAVEALHEPVVESVTNHGRRLHPDLQRTVPAF
jgi:hypothetical protein